MYKVRSWRRRSQTSSSRTPAIRTRVLIDAVPVPDPTRRGERRGSIAAPTNCFLHDGLPLRAEVPRGDGRVPGGAPAADRDDTGLRRRVPSGGEPVPRALAALMEFDLSVEQQLFAESVRRLATDRLAEGTMATDELTSRFLPQLFAGEEVIAFGMTEPDRDRR